MSAKTTKATVKILTPIEIWRPPRPVITAALRPPIVMPPCRSSSACGRGCLRDPSSPLPCASQSLCHRADLRLLAAGLPSVYPVGPWNRPIGVAQSRRPTLADHAEILVVLGDPPAQLDLERVAPIDQEVDR